MVEAPKHQHRDAKREEESAYNGPYKEETGRLKQRTRQAEVARKPVGCPDSGAVVDV